LFEPVQIFVVQLFGRIIDQHGQRIAV
jgi:hypothetical protein